MDIQNQVASRPSLATTLSTRSAAAAAATRQSVGDASGTHSLSRPPRVDAAALVVDAAS